MKSTTREHIWPMWLAALGVVAMLAMMAFVVWTPGAAQAQDGPTNPFGTPPPAEGTPTPRLRERLPRRIR